MPKMKSKKAAVKRIRQTKTGKIKVGSCSRSHLLRHKSKKQKRRLRKTRYASEAMESRVARLIPYGAPK